VVVVRPSSAGLLAVQVAVVVLKVLAMVAQAQPIKVLLVEQAACLEMVMLEQVEARVL
jgi:hypothetical protein